MSQIPTKAREVVRRRQNGQCMRCGNRYSDLHHRQRRREGGHSYENLVGLCGTCHKWVHANPAKARELGYIIPISVNDITAVQLSSFIGLVHFTIDGGITFADDN